MRWHPANAMAAVREDISKIASGNSGTQILWYWPQSPSELEVATAELLFDSLE